MMVTPDGKIGRALEASIAELVGELGVEKRGAGGG